MRVLHFAELKRDLPGQIRSIADFLEIDIQESSWKRIIEHCSFDYMKAHAENAVPLRGIAWEGGAKTFIHKGTNGRWRDLLSAEDNARYESMATEKLGAECAQWLASGEYP
jgi:aryl sulfotransferase